jgi:hypothetical protein
MLVFILCAVRASFFFVSIGSWDSESGVVISNKVAFYSLDEFATVLFFSLTSILALFWAELYYISIDQAHVFTNIVRPLTYLLNLVAYITIAICSYMVTVSYKNDVDYIYIQYSMLIAITYLLSAAIFGYYAHAAANELAQVPIQLSARKSRLRTLKVLAVICISALIIRPVIVFALTNQSLRTDSSLTVSLFFLYYALLELLPTIATIVFYRVEIMDTSSGPLLYEYDQCDDWETTPLNRADHEQLHLTGSSVEGCVAAPVSGEGRGDLRRISSEEVVNNLIEKLSDNGNSGGGGGGGGGAGRFKHRGDDYA